MSAVGAKAFTESHARPTSEEVSLIRTSWLPQIKGKIRIHITGCEYCAAVQRLHFAYPQTIEDCELAEMPSHLRWLSEALLRETVKQSCKGSEFKEDVFTKDRFFAFEPFVPGM